MQKMFNTLLSRVTLSRSRHRSTEEENKVPQSNPTYAQASLIDDVHDDHDDDADNANANAHTHANASSSTINILRELTQTIESTQKNIAKMEQTEQFIDLRIRAYRRWLAECSMKMSQDSDTWTTEEKIRRVRNQEKYHLQICDVMDVQRNILAEVESLKRKCRDLECKRDELIHKTEEREELVMAHAALELEEGGSRSQHDETEELHSHLHLHSHLDVEQGKQVELTSRSLSVQCGSNTFAPSEHSPREVT